MPSTILVHVTASPRGGSRPELSFHAQSINITSGWGSSPATGTVVYVSNDLIAASPVTVGDGVRITVGGHLYYGLCRSDAPSITSSGHTRTLEFVDYRELLDYDAIFGAFNIAEIRLVNGRRLKRYWHIFPADYNAGLRTYTNTPLLAYEILDYLFSANTVGTAWTRFYNGLLSTPIYGLDCLGGRKLNAVVAEISERLGIVYAHVPVDSEIFRLAWIRKGFGSVPAFPDNSDNRRIGTALSNHPNRIRIVGDVNLYQVMDVGMTKDWAAGWEEFPDFDSFVNDIYQRQFADLEDDPEQIIGRQNARVAALQMTVREYAAIRGASFVDQRKLSGRSRMDMPVALYLSTLLYRAFRPTSGQSFVNVYGRTIPMDRASLVGGLLARVSHDPEDGEMELDLDVDGRPQPADGTGYAIAKGYMVGADLFATIRPERFNISEWNSANDVWRYVPFQIDDSGEPQNAFIIFDDPVIVAKELLTAVDGHTVVNAVPHLLVPNVSAALTFSCEHYFWPPNDEGYLGVGSRDGVENVPSLNGEYVVEGGIRTEVPYADGQSVDDKAEVIAVNLLNRQAIYTEGGYQVQGSNATGISSVIDRVQVKTSPAGLNETVDFTNERGRNNFEPERELDRRTVQNSYFPGQIELIGEARKAKLITAGLRQMPGFVRFLGRLLRGDLGSGPSGEVLRQYQVDPRVLDGDTETYAVGTPFWKEPADDNTMVLPPAQGLEEAKVFAGVSVRAGEVSGAPFLLQSSGLGLARVKGPVEVGDTVGRDSELVGDYLIKNGNPAVGLALQTIDDETVKLIQVQLGAGASSGNSGLYQVWEVHPDYLVCRAVTIAESGFIDVGDEDIFIAKPFDLRKTPFDGETIDDVLYDAFNGDGTQRRATRDDIAEQEIVIPPYIDDPEEGANRSIIRALSVQHTGVFVGGEELVLEEDSPRYFAEISD